MHAEKCIWNRYRRASCKKEGGEYTRRKPLGRVEHTTSRREQARGRPRALGREVVSERSLAAGVGPLTLHGGHGLGEHARHHDTDTLEHTEKDTTTDGRGEGRLGASWRDGQLKRRSVSHNDGERAARNNKFDNPAAARHRRRRRRPSSPSLLTSQSEGAASAETGHDGVPWVLLLPVSLDGAVKRREQTTPDTKVTAEDGGTRLDS